MHCILPFVASSVETPLEESCITNVLSDLRKANDIVWSVISTGTP